MTMVKEHSIQSDVSNHSNITRASHWLADALTNTMRLQTEIAAVDSTRRQDIRSKNYPLLSDAEKRLALALEAYGVAIKGDPEDHDNRFEDIIRELEVPTWATRRSPVRLEYRDPMEARETTRELRRRLQKLRKQADRLRQEGGNPRELKNLDQEIGVLEEITG